MHVFLALVLFLAWQFDAHAGAILVVVVNPASGVETLTREDVINIFLGRYRRLPSGILAQPIDQPTGQAAKALFYKLLVNKDLADINSYWSRLIFSGKTKPPWQAHDSREVVKWVSTLSGAIAYMPLDQVDAQCKIVLRFD